MCQFVCLSANHTRDLYQIFMHVAYRRGSVLLRQGDAIPRGKGDFGFSPLTMHCNLYSIAFETHTKTAEPIEMPVGLMTRVGFRYHVLCRGPDPPRGMGTFGGNVAAPCKVMGHYGARCKNG